MKIGTEITLSDTECAMCERLARDRQANTSGSQLKNARIGKQTDEAINLEGVAGEFAFCKLFNLFPDFTTHPRSASDGTDAGDCVLHDGRLVDVKTTSLERGRMLAALWKKPTSVDLYALMTGSLPTFTFRGFIPADELIREDRIEDLGHGPTYAVQQYQLHELY